MSMRHVEIVETIADLLKGFDSERPVHKTFQPGIGPFGEPQLVREIAGRLTEQGIRTHTRRTPDMDIQSSWAIEFKVVRPFGDNGRKSENWSQNLLHPYEGNVSLIGDAIKLSSLTNYAHKCVFVIGYEHDSPKVSLDPLLASFELIARCVMGIRLSGRVEETRTDLVHPVHQVLRCISWELVAYRQ